VVRTYGEVQVLNRHAVSGDVLGLLWGWSDLDAFSSGIQLASQAEELDQGAAGRSQGVAGRNGGLGFHVDDQLVKVGALLNTRRFDLVRDLQHRGVHLVNRNASDVTRSWCSRNVAPGPLNDEFHVQRRSIIQSCDGQLSLVDFHTSWWLNVASGN